MTLEELIKQASKKESELQVLNSKLNTFTNEINAETKVLKGEIRTLIIELRKEINEYDRLKAAEKLEARGEAEAAE